MDAFYFVKLSYGGQFKCNTLSVIIYLKLTLSITYPYNKLLNAESSTAFINELTAIDIDRNLHNAIVEAVSADGCI